MDEIGKRFEGIRKNLGMTQKEFSDYLDLSMGSIQSYESGKIPKGEIFQKLAASGFDLHWLFTGQGEIRKPRIVRAPAYDVKLERMLIWNVAYFMCKRAEMDNDPEEFADAFMTIFDQMNLSQGEGGHQDDQDEVITNIIDFPMQRRR